MDWRLTLLVVVVAAAAAVRWRPRSGEASGPGSLSAPEAEPPQASSPSEAELSSEAEQAESPQPDPAPRRRRRPSRAEASLPPEDADLEEALDRVWAEHADRTDALLDARLRVIVQRVVPVRALRPAPGGGVIRIGFADGTVLLCRSMAQGDFGRLLIATRVQSVRVSGFHRAEHGMQLDFAWVPNHHAAVVAVGLDQPD